MSTIQWRPEVNALTKPQSYRIQYMPRSTAGYADMATDISTTHPTYNAELIRSLSPLMMDWIQQRLINGEQVTLEDAFTFRLSFTGKLEGAENQLPEDEEILQVKAYASRPFVRKVRHAARLERLPAEEKLPLLTTSEDTVLDLHDVLYNQGLLKLNGNNLFFDHRQERGECVIEGTHNGRTVQSRFGMVSNSEILLVPDIPVQDNPWNNEYTLSVSTRYTEHGTLRTGIYRRKLRTPLTLSNLGNPKPQEVGILTGNAGSPYVNVTGGMVTADETLRIQVILDLRADNLSFSLLDMDNSGATGAEVIVTGNGERTLPGFLGSAVSALNIRVNDYAALKAMIRNDYSDRLVDILEIKVAKK